MNSTQQRKALCATLLCGLLTACGGGGGAGGDNGSIGNSLDTKNLEQNITNAQQWQQQASAARSNTSEQPHNGFHSDDIAALTSAITTAQQTLNNATEQSLLDAASSQLNNTINWFSGRRISHQADRNILLQGVASFPQTNHPSIVAAIERSSLTVALNEPGRALMVASRYGKGRVILAGREALISGRHQAPNSSDSARLFENMLRWLTDHHSIRYADATTDNPMPLALHSGWSNASADWPISNQSDNNQDGVAPNPQQVPVLIAHRRISEAEADALINYVQNGGNVIISYQAWNLPDHRSQPSQRFLNTVGLAWTPDWRYGSTNAMSASDDDHHWSQVSNGLQLLQEAEAGNPPSNAPDSDGIANLATRHGSNVAEIQRSHALHQSLQADYQAANIRYPQNDLPDNPWTRFLILWHSSQLTLAANQNADPTAHDFPGSVPSSASRVSEDINFDFEWSNRSDLRASRSPRNWQGTGLYAPAGENITITVPDTGVIDGNRRLYVRVGYHSDYLGHKEHLQRAPTVSLRQQLQTGSQTINSPYGGYIMLDSSDESAAASISININGAIRAPQFVLGRDSDSDWVNTIRNLPGPWAELVSSRMGIHLPSEFIRGLTNPTALMQAWDEFVVHMNDFSGLSDQAALPHTSPQHPHRMVADIQISAGYLHAGYPIMGPLDNAYGRGLARINDEQGSLQTGWGFWHELGHNYQQNAWKLPDTVEVTVNMWSLYMQEQYTGKNRLSGQGSYNQAEALIDQNADWDQHSVWTKLVMYDQIRLHCGWASYATLQTRAREETNYPSGQQAQNDWFLVQMSDICNTNLSNHFEDYGITITSEAKAQAASNLPPLRPLRGLRP